MVRIHSPTNHFYYYNGAFLFLVAVSTAYLLACPYTKVEESFAIQATHDLYYHGIRPAIRHRLLQTSNDMEEDYISPLYDHLQYPGVVPRSFAGPLALAGFTYLIANSFVGTTLDPFTLQCVARFGLMLFVLHALYRLGRSISSRFSSTTSETVGTWFLLLCACQFHIPYYSSRTLPNTFALGLIVHAYTEWFRGRPYMACWILVFCAAVVRCDTIILLGTIGLSMLLQGEMTLAGALVTGISGGITALLTTVPLDSILWQKSFLWPEAVVLFFNTVQNKSSDYGVMVWHWYFTRALPRAMLATGLLVFVASTTVLDWISWWMVPRSTTRRSNSSTVLALPPLIPQIHSSHILYYLLPVLAFVVLYSFLPHKEMRFIFPAIPMLNVAAALGMDRLSTLSSANSNKRKNYLLYKFLFVGGVLCLVITFLGSCLFGAISYYNYPGGVALAMLQPHILNMSDATNDTVTIICIDIESSMTGVTLFGQEKLISLNSNLQFIKEGYEAEHNRQHWMDQCDFLLSEDGTIPNFEVLEIAPGNPTLQKRRIVTQDKIFVLRRLHSS